MDFKCEEVIFFVDQRFHRIEKFVESYFKKIFL